ncbi:hypothetical protein [Alkaliphilus crotonatoxidans]
MSVKHLGQPIRFFIPIRNEEQALPKEPEKYNGLWKKQDTATYRQREIDFIHRAGKGHFKRLCNDPVLEMKSMDKNPKGTMIL